MNRSQKFSVLLLCLVFGFTLVAMGPGKGPYKKGPKGPPEAAMEACDELLPGDECAFESKNGEIVEGVCMEVKAGLVCLPEDFEPRGPGDRPKGPPESAFEACDGLGEDDECEFETKNGNVISGVCKDKDGDGEFVCAPRHRHRWGPKNGDLL